MADPLQASREKLQAGQQELDLGLSSSGGSVIAAKRSRWLIEAIETGWRRSGFDTIDNNAYFQLVLDRLGEPTSLSDTARVVGEIGLTPPSAPRFPGSSE